MFVTKLIAVFHASDGVIGVAGSCRCSGSLPCTNWKKEQEQDADRRECQDTAGVGVPGPLRASGSSLMARYGSSFSQFRQSRGEV